MTDRKILQSTVVNDPAPKLGEFSSDDYNRFHQAAVHDIGNLVTSVNSLNTRLEDALWMLKAETSYLKKRMIDLERDGDYRKSRAARLSQTVDDWIDFHDTKNLSHPTDQPERLRALIDGKFGEATLPIKALQNKFYVQSLSTGNIIPPNDLRVSVTSVFDKLDGNGVTDYESSGVVVESQPENAFNGVNNSIWRRRVEFSLDSPVTEVECEITVTIPDQSIAESNLISLMPFPYGEVDITHLSFSPDLGSSFQAVPGFSESLNSRNMKYHFTPRVMSQIKVRLKQRNWFEDNGKKVFVYGMEELGLALAEWEKTYVPGGDINQNSTFVVKFEAPSEYNIEVLRSINFSPDFTKEDTAKRNVHVVLSSTPDFGGEFWNSDTQNLPQNQQGGLAVGNLTTMYAIVTLSFVESSGGVGSPYEVGTPAYLNGIGIQYSAEEE